MKYKVQLTAEFLEEIDDICYYISKKLKVKNASNRLRKRVIDSILLLEESPQIYMEISKVGREEKRYRRIVINNYIVLYTIDENDKVIYIAHIYYSGRNYLRLL